MDAVNTPKIAAFIAPLAPAAAVLIAVLLLLPGCETDKHVVKESFPMLRQLADKPGKPQEPTSLEQRVRRGGWTVLLAHFTGDNPQEQANVLARRLALETNLPDVWTYQTPDGSAVYCGLFQSTNEPLAAATLAQARRTEIDNVRYFEFADLVPVGGTTPDASQNPMNLAQYSGMYSLQIAVFDDNYPGGRYDGAEQYAKQLHDNGEQAYFHHGPNRSMVTLGLFNYEDAFRRVPNPASPGTLIDAYTQTILDLQRTHPYNLVNGYTLFQRFGGDTGARAEQPSVMIRVP